MESNTYYDGGIDIEEHDVMEHPAFKSAFPDLSIVKTEIYDEEYDDYGMQFQALSQHQGEEYPPMEDVAADSTTDVLPEALPSPPQDLVSSTDHVLDKICISSVSGYHQHHQDPPAEECAEKVNDKNVEGTISSEDMEIDVNIGNECDKTEYEEKCFRSFVRIENVAVTLNSSDEFCKTCNILLPNRLNMLQHNNEFHAACESDSASMVSLDDARSQLSHLEEMASETASSHLEEMLRPQRIRDASVKRPYKCDRCEKTFTQQSHVGRHMREVHQSEARPRSLREKATLHLCKLCNTSFNTKFLLIRHLYNHVGEGKKFKCDFCPEVFDQKVYLEAHLWKHVKDRYVNAKASDLQHVKPVTPTAVKYSSPSKHGTNMLVLRCNKCFCIYCSKKVLRRHMLAEHKVDLKGDIPKDMIVTTDEIKCYYCQRVYSERKYLNMHILTMCKDRKDAVSKNAPELKVKMKRVTQTSVAVKKKIVLKKHVLPMKRYYCKKCKISFEKYKGYYRHMTQRHNIRAPLRVLAEQEVRRAHKKYTLHKCNDCHAHFHKKSAVLNHVKVACHSKKLIKCDRCNLKFTVKTFTMHQKWHPSMSVNAVKYDVVGYDTNRNKMSDVHSDRRKIKHAYLHSKSCVFRCRECKCHFTKFMVAAKHAALHLDSPKRVLNAETFSCEECALTFTKFGLETHRRLHKTLRVDRFTVLEFDHKLYRTNRWIDSILNQTGAQTEGRNVKTEHAVGSRLKVTREERDSPFVKDESGTERSDSVVSRVAPSVASLNVRPIYLYKCTQCSFHYNLFKSASSHLYKTCSVRRHKLPPCARCDYLFATAEAHSLYHRGVKANKLEVIEFDRTSPPTVDKACPATMEKGVASNALSLPVALEATCESTTPSIQRTATRQPTDGLTTSVKPKRKAKLYTCNLCGAHFVSTVSYTYHVVRSHTLGNGNVDIKPCSICDLAFTKAGLKKHRRSHHNGRAKMTRDDFEIIVLDEEGQVIVENEKEHVSNVGTLNNGVITYQCALCDNRYMTKAALGMHVNMDHMEVDMCCQICDKMFPNPGLRKAHLECGDSTFKCCICKAVLPLGELQEHSLCHCNVYKCRQCGATFPKLEMLDEHLEISHADFDRGDDEDGRAVSVLESGEELSSDMENTVEYTVAQSKAFNLGVSPHNASAKRVLSNVCTECDYETTDQIKFVLHRHAHKDYGPMDCNKCGMKFIWNKNLMRHLRDKRCRD